MRKLLLFFAMLCVSIGAWAEVSVSTSGGICTITNDQAGDLASYAFTDADKAATKVIVSGSVSTADLNHLSELASAVTLDLDGCNPSDGVSGFTVASSVDYVSLPGGLDREQVKAFGEANTGIKSAYSAFPHFNKVERSTSTNVDEFVCYVREGGSLRSCINATNDAPADFVAKAKYLTMIGTAMPLDYASGNPYFGVTNTLTSENHVSVSATVSSDNVTFTGTGTKTLYDMGNAITFFNANIVSLDMRDMRLSGPSREADLTLSMLGYPRAGLKYLVLPIGDPNLKTLPKGCLANLSDLMSVNIPSTVQVLKSGSLWGSAKLFHIWTDGTDESKRYDYGAVLSVDEDGNETVVYADDIVDRTPIYGKWVMPASIAYIETILTSAIYVKDLYMMGAVAPVCEVDAFGATMYIANNGCKATSGAKIIAREYYQNHEAYEWLTMLHYPVETTAPNIQRYTDPTREYTAATGLKDDKGNTIYLPTQNEWNRAFLQGTTGYVWKAWNTVRDENAAISLPGNIVNVMGYSNGNQVLANDAYSKDWDEDSYLSSFYDVTDGGSLTKPSTLENYYNVYWNESQYKLNNTESGVQLYPRAETEDATDGEGNVITAERPVYDANGNIIYDLDNTNGTYVKEYANGYYEDSQNGTFVEETTESYVEQTGGDYIQVVTEEYVKVSGQNEYNAEEYNNQSQYYVLINGEYVQGAGGDTNWWQGDHYKKVSSVSYRLAEAGETGNYAMVEVGTGTYVTATDEDKAAGKTLYSYGLIWTGNYVAATSEQMADATIDKYSQRMETYNVQTVTNTNDYRGWHQFVLTGYSAFDKVPTIYDKVYTSDTDWWTICMPYDLTYSEVMRYFSDGTKIPVVSKLQYVKRDAEKGQITLCFSKNLMKNKEDFSNGGSMANVHGDLDDNGVLKIQVGTVPAADDVVLHAGVAYLIKPTLPASASHTQTIRLTEVVSGQTLTPEQEADNALYNKIKAAQQDENNWGDMVKNAIYTVPAFDVVSDGSLTVDGVKCNKSSEFTYSFVGTLFKSPMPTNCYFLGWDSKKNKAAFWYNKYSDPTDWNWGNMTGIICPNLTSGVSVTPSVELKVAAHWDLDGKMEDDSMGGEAGAKRMPEMLFEVDVPEGSSTTGISEIQKTDTEGKTIYNLNGVRVSGSQKSLAKGVYIVNGKKVVVK